MLSGVRLYSLYLNNMVKDIDGYILTKNLSSSEISISDLFDLAKDLDDMIYLSDNLVECGESSLISSFDFLKSKLPMDSKGIMLSDMGVDMVSNEVLKYCGSLLESNKPIDTKKLGRLFKDISDGLTSANALSEQLLGDIYSSSDSIDDYDDDYDVDYDLDDDLSEDVETYGINVGSGTDGYLKTDKIEELEYNDYTSEQSLIDAKDSFSDSSMYNNPSVTEGYSIDSFEDIGDINSPNNRLKDDITLSYSGNGTINDKLAYAITKVSKQISKTPNKVKEGSKVVYTNMIDFDS